MPELLFSMLMCSLLLLAFLKLPLWGRDSAPAGNEADRSAAPQAAASGAEIILDAAAVRVRTTQLSDALQASASLLQDAELADCLGRICSSLNLLTANAETDARDIPAILRFLDRYGEHTRKLAKNYAMLEQAEGKTEAMRQSMRKLKKMLEELALAYERFRLSLYKNDIRQANEEIELLRSMLRQDGLDGGRGTAARFAAAELRETEAQR